MFVATLTHPDVTAVQVVTWDGVSRQLDWAMIQPGHSEKALHLQVDLLKSDGNDFQEIVNARSLKGGWYPTFAG